MNKRIIQYLAFIVLVAFCTAQTDLTSPGTNAVIVPGQVAISQDGVAVASGGIAVATNGGTAVGTGGIALSSSSSPDTTEIPPDSSTTLPVQLVPTIPAPTNPPTADPLPTEPIPSSSTTTNDPGNTTQTSPSLTSSNNQSTNSTAPPTPPPSTTIVASIPKDPPKTIPTKTTPLPVVTPTQSPNTTLKKRGSLSTTFPHLAPRYNNFKLFPRNMPKTFDPHSFTVPVPNPKITNIRPQNNSR